MTAASLRAMDLKQRQAEAPLLPPAAVNGSRDVAEQLRFVDQGGFIRTLRCFPIHGTRPLCGVHSGESHVPLKVPTGRGLYLKLKRGQVSKQGFLAGPFQELRAGLGQLGMRR